MKILLLLCCSFFTVLSATAQGRTVTGRVTGSDGLPLPGVHVAIKGSAMGTITNDAGKYALNLPGGGGGGDNVLSFSFIGYVSIERAVGVQAIIDCIMEEEVKELEEVVISMPGGLKAREKELGSSTTVISSATLTAGKAVNIASGLQGKIAGFQINATSSGVNPDFRLILRGARSLTGNNQALIVLDNVIVPSSMLSNLNMNDVESVTVLNGSGAAALYGSQASNGAVMITTKRGKKGKVDINVSQNVTFSEVAFMPKIQTKFGAGGTGYGSTQDGSPLFNYLENQSYGPAFDGIERNIGAPTETGRQDRTTYDFKDARYKFWDIGKTHQTDISFSTGDDKSSLFVSGQYVTVTGTTPGDKFSRGNLRINGTHKMGKKVDVSFSAVYAPNAYDVTSQTAAIYDGMLNMPQNIDIPKYKNWRDPNSFGNPNNFYNPWYLNPYFTADNFRAKTTNRNLTGNVGVTYAPRENLSFTVRQGITNRDYINKGENGSFTYSEYAKHTDQSAKQNIVGSTAEASYSTTQSITDFIAQYNAKISDFHLTAALGSQLVENQSTALSVHMDGMVVKGLYNLSNGTGNPTFGGASFKTHLAGVFGKTTLGYKDMIFITATGRNDWDSRLIESNRSFFYPSLDASVVLSDLIPSIKTNKFIRYLKLRGGISKVGQVNLAQSSFGFSDFGAYATKPIFSAPSGFPFGALSGFSVGNDLVSDNLKPEITHQQEAGFDASLWNERASVNFTYFHSNTTEQTVRTSLSRATGFSQLLTNVGKTESKGIELTWSVTPYKAKDFSIEVGGNYTYLINKVLSISEALPSINLATEGSATSSAAAGEPFPVIMGIDYVRDPKGRVVVDAFTGLPELMTKPTILGNGTPRNRVGATANISYKAITFSVLFEYRGDYSIFNGIGGNMDWSGTSYRSAIYDRKSFVFPNSVIKNADGTFAENKTVMIANGNGSPGFWTDKAQAGATSNYVTSGNFIKLREVALSYDLTKMLTGGNHAKYLKGAVISLQGRNLFLWMAKDNYYTDPEYSSAGANGNGSGLNNASQTPPVRYFGATLALKL